MRAGPEVRALLHGADELQRQNRALPGRRRGLRAPTRGRLRAGAGGAGVRGERDQKHRQAPGARGVRAAAAADGGRAGPPSPPPFPLSAPSPWRQAGGEPVRRPGARQAARRGASLTGACGEQGPTHKLVLRAKGNYGSLLSTKFRDYAAARPVQEAVVAGCACLAPVVGRPLPSPRPTTAAPSPSHAGRWSRSARHPRSAPPLDRARTPAACRPLVTATGRAWVRAWVRWGVGRGRSRTALYSATHPETLTARNNLAVTLKNLGEHGRARAEYEAVIAGRTEQLGSGHARTLSTQWCLGARRPVHSAPRRALSLPAAVGWACSLRAPVLSPPLRATRCAPPEGAPLPLGAAALPPLPPLAADGAPPPRGRSAPAQGTARRPARRGGAAARGGGRGARQPGHGAGARGHEEVRRGAGAVGGAGGLARGARAALQPTVALDVRHQQRARLLLAQPAVPDHARGADGGREGPDRKDGRRIQQALVHTAVELVLLRRAVSPHPNCERPIHHIPVVTHQTRHHITTHNSPKPSNGPQPTALLIRRSPLSSKSLQTTHAEAMPCLHGGRVESGACTGAMTPSKKASRLRRRA
eukprot:COSAG01_NODE_312_length_19063_cov_207.879825_4_plen_587_part_00